MKKLILSILFSIFLFANNIEGTYYYNDYDLTITNVTSNSFEFNTGGVSSRGSMCGGFKGTATFITENKASYEVKKDKWGNYRFDCIYTFIINEDSIEILADDNRCTMDYCGSGASFLHVYSTNKPVELLPCCSVLKFMKEDYEVFLKKEYDVDSHFNNDDWLKLISPIKNISPLENEDEEFWTRMNAPSMVTVKLIDSTKIYITMGFMAAWGKERAMIAYDDDGNIWAIRTAWEDSYVSADRAAVENATHSGLSASGDERNFVYHTNVEADKITPPSFLTLIKEAKSIQK